MSTTSWQLQAAECAGVVYSDVQREAAGRAAPNEIGLANGMYAALTDQPVPVECPRYGSPVMSSPELVEWIEATRPPALRALLGGRSVGDQTATLLSALGRTEMRLDERQGVATPESSSNGGDRVVFQAATDPGAGRGPALRFLWTRQMEDVSAIELVGTTLVVAEGMGLTCLDAATGLELSSTEYDSEHSDGQWIENDHGTLTVYDAASGDPIVMVVCPAGSGLDLSSDASVSVSNEDEAVQIRRGTQTWRRPLEDAWFSASEIVAAGSWRWWCDSEGLLTGCNVGEVTHDELTASRYQLLPERRPPAED